jgi:hypothetical protein
MMSSIDCLIGAHVAWVICILSIGRLNLAGSIAGRRLKAMAAIGVVLIVLDAIAFNA